MSDDVMANLSSPNQKLSIQNKMYPEPNITITNKYNYWENSCYLDSLMTVLYFTKTDVFRDAIFTTNVNIVYYSINLINNICDSNSKVKSVESLRFIAERFQISAFQDYIKLSNMESATKCTTLRETIKFCVPSITSSPSGKGSYIMYNVSEIYDIIANLFPSLKGNPAGYPYKLLKDFPTKKQHMSAPKSVFLFWEFMEIPDIKQIEWDKIDNDILVFRNGGLPAIINFGSSESELIETIEYVKNKKGVFSPTQITQKIKKFQAFGSHIINNRYEMVGAVVLGGVRPGLEGGSHYTSYINTSDGWYYYNDMGPTWKKTSKSVGGADAKAGFPNNILKEARGIKPELYFYALVKK